MPRRIISGGQTGVDQAALRAAIDLGLDHGGWRPPGRICEAGAIPANFKLQETPADRSPDAPHVPRSQRTERNVRDADATLVLRPAQLGNLDPGTEWTLRCAERFGKPALVCDPSVAAVEQAIREWLATHSIHTLNVAGPSETTAPGIGAQAYDVLIKALAVEP